LAGELIAVNTFSFEQDILIANRDPYGAGWLARLRPSNLAADLAELRTGEPAVAAYRQRVDELAIRCYRCVD
jgi:glycine cleavage system H protein